MVLFDRKALDRLCRQHDVKRLRLFGSAARGEDHPDSDIDLLVEFDSPKGFFALIELENRLTEMLERPVDLLTEGGINPYVKKSILSTTAVLFDGTE